MRTVLWSSSAGDIPANLAFTNNYGASTDPGVGNDTTQGYQVGSVWVNTTDGKTFQCTSATKGAAVWVQTSQAEGLATQPAPAAHDTAATLTAADIQAGIITSNPAAAINLQLPLATAMDTAYPQAAANSAVNFTVVNTSSTAIDTDTITTNTGWTLVGNMVVTPATTGGASANFRARKTGAGAWVLYRV
jgi:hypothetical protein